MKVQAAGTESSLAGQVRVAFFALSLCCCLLSQSGSVALAQKLKAIDPSSLKLDDDPSPAAGNTSGSGSGNGSGAAGSGAGFNDTPIQGRPLGSTFQPINRAPSGAGGGQQADQGAGFGNSMSPPSDEPVASAQDEDRVNNLEQKAFGCNYHEHEVPDRLDHLEKEVLGAAKDGPIPERIARLEVKLLGGTGFGAQPSPVSQRTAASPPPRGGNSGAIGSGNDGGANGGNGWLTQPPGTAINQPPQRTTQSDWQLPSGMQPPMQQSMQPPMQQSMQPPMQQSMQPPMQQSMQPPMQQSMQPPMQQSMQPPMQQSMQPPMQQSMQPPMQQRQQMPPQQQPPRQQMPAQQRQQMATQQQPPRQQMPSQQQQAMQPPQQQLAPPQQQYGQPPQNYVRPPSRQAGPAPMGLTADVSVVAGSLFYDLKAGDYVSAIRRFPPGAGQAGPSYAHWRTFPVRVRLPKESPESWQRALEAVVARWDQYVPVKLALPLEAAPVEVSWVNQLPPKILAVTRLNIAHGDLHVNVFLLRPSFYPPEIPERTLAGIFMHEVGHALGLFGHSEKTSDLMFPAVIPPAVKGKATQINFAPVSTRDINTLKKIYESPAVPSGVSLEQPLEWSDLAPDAKFIDGAADGR